MFADWMGTVGLALLWLVAVAYMLREERKALPDKEREHVDTAALRTTRRPQGRVATDRRGDHDGALLALSQDQRRRLAARRHEASTQAPGPAGLESRGVSHTAKLPVDAA